MFFFGFLDALLYLFQPFKTTEAAIAGNADILKHCLNDLNIDGIVVNHKDLWPVYAIETTLNMFHRVI